jgi:16S rRNA (adenine1518-N6/adenine1519-N6)-dimethyltransferase
MVGMFQKEVAERVVAPAGSKTYGVISVLVQAYYEGELLFTVGRGNFTPPPKVESAVIRLVRKEENSLGCDYKMLRRVVKQAFSQRRKMLRNTMKLFSKDKDFLASPLLSRRPEQLTLEEFVALTKTIEAL